MPIQIFHIDKSYQRQLGQIRHLSDCWIVETDATFWLKIERPQNEFPLVVEQIPTTAKYRLEDQILLFPIKGSTPVGKLPEMDWQPIASFMPVELPTAALPGSVDQQIPVKLIRTEAPKETPFMLLSWQSWVRYALQTSNIRLKPLSFAVSAQQEVLVQGEPLPALPGLTFWQNQQVLLPAGWNFEHPVLAEILSNNYLNGKEEWLLLRSEQAWERIKKKNFIQTSRSAVRKTQAHLDNMIRL